MFDDVVSQMHITSTLKNEIKNEKIAHAYLFTGSRGTGKTTCAKIFSKAINCLNAKDGEPCCECSVCQGLDDSSILDVIEMDGASNNSVNDVRILRDEANFVPSSCRYRVYIIDEAHMLSVSAFNALLKIMEEPPKYVVFILATTEIHKIPITIRSRCQRFDFKRVSCEDIQNRLIHISSNENFELSDEAACKISQLSDGSMRDAISVLDQCASITNTVTLETVNSILGLIDKAYILELHRYILDGDVAEIIKIVDLLYRKSVDIQYLCSELTRFYREVMLSLVLDLNSYQSLSSYDFLDVSERRISKNLNISKIIKILDILQNCSENIKNSSNKRLLFEVCILKIGSIISNDESSKSAENILSDKKSLSDNSVSNSVNNNSKLLFSSDTKAKNNKEIGNKEFKQNNNIVPLDNWQDILDDIRDKDKNGMLFGFLVGSQAFVVEDKLYINSKNSIVAEKVLEKKAFINDVIRSRTGKDYRIFVKKTSTVRHNGNKLKDFLQSAAKAGIPIDEE